MAFLGDTARDVLRKTAAGMAFGAALTASRVYQPTIILDQMRLTDFTMLKTFLTAVSSSAFIMLAVEKASDWRRPVRSNSSMDSTWLTTRYDGNIIGGALIGIGMGLAGACPGTVIVQLAQGTASARWTMVGALLGGLVHHRYRQRAIYRRIPGRPRSPVSISSSADFSPPETIMSKFSISETPVLASFGLVFAGLLSWALFLEPDSTKYLNPAVGGLLIAAAQTVSIVLTADTLGASGVYEQVARYFWRTVGSTTAAKPSSPPLAIIFAIGMIAGSLSLSLTAPSLLALEGPMTHISPIKSVLGGFALAYGSRCANGCTSGHGISGVAALSFSSVIAVASMFSAGIITKALV